MWQKWQNDVIIIIYYDFCHFCHHVAKVEK